MNRDATFKLTFRVFHPTIAATDIERFFRLSTKYSQSVGELRKTKKGEMLGGNYKMTSVSFRLHEAVLSFDNAPIDDFLQTQLRRYNTGYTRYIVESGGDCNFLLGIFSSGNVMFELSLETITMLANAKISIKYDFYGSE